MFSRLKRFDVYSKSFEGVNQQTLLGALITVASAVIVAALLISEFSYFQKINIVSRLEVDRSVGTEAVKLVFDLTFPHVVCERIAFTQEVTRGAIHSKESAHIDKEAAVNPNNPLELSGCRLNGFMVIDKLSGNFKFGIAMQNNEPPDLSHTINYLSFIPTTGKLANDKVPDASSNITNVEVPLPLNTGVYHYTLQVIPTQYKELYGDVSHMNQYSLSEKVITFEQARGGDIFSPFPSSDFLGLMFSYDFHPVMLFMEERRERIVDFVCNLCGIIGGIVTLLGLLERFLQGSAKALIGKKD